jgi:hypothetical protein
LPKKNLNSSGPEDKICVDDMDDSKEEVISGEEGDKAEEESEKQERTFLTFSDFDSFRRNFPQRKPRETQQVKLIRIQKLLKI